MMNGIISYRRKLIIIAKLLTTAILLENVAVIAQLSRLSAISCDRAGLGVVHVARDTGHIVGTEAVPFGAYVTPQSVVRSEP